MRTSYDRSKRARRARKGDRSFQPSAAGKGYQSRVDDMEAYRRNFDEINWSGKRKRATDIKTDICDVLKA